MKEIQEAIEKSKVYDEPKDWKGYQQLYLFDESKLLHLLSLVAEKQRGIDGAEVNSTHGALYTPLITDNLKQ